MSLVAALRCHTATGRNRRNTAAPDRPANLPAAEGLPGLALEQFPQAAVVHAHRGELFALKGDNVQAIAAYQTALRLNPDDKDLLRALRRMKNEE